ncbi:MAG TPA: chemotaxis protein CheD [Anaerovoracaceae bacterium]|nr:chemotaxis protein CheD [Anaerovoracaceae bacterium]
MSQSLIVGISDYKVTKHPNMLITYALGSCVGIALYDGTLKVGGLSHIMLPESTQFSRNETNRMKFADTAIVDLVNDMRKLGSDARRITAKIAGGAKMFETQPGSSIGSIGDRNVESVRKILKKLQIPITGEDTGKDYGRTVYFDLGTGQIKVSSLNKCEVVL